MRNVSNCDVCERRGPQGAPTEPRARVSVFERRLTETPPRRDPCSPLFIFFGPYL